MRLRPLNYYLQKLPGQSKNIIQTCLFGLGAGLITVVFQLTMNRLWRDGISALADSSRHSFLTFLVGSFILIISSSLAVGWLLTSFCPEAAGSGIPQLKIAFWKDFGLSSWRLVWVKFAAGVLSIGGGSSMGREGPSVQIAGAVGSNIAGLMGEPKQNRRMGAAAGAAAGLAAAFNTPLASVTFVLEEIIGDLNSRFLGSVLLASVLGALVVHGVIGERPAFAIPPVKSLSWLGYVLTPLAAAVASVVGVWFQRIALQVRQRNKTQTRIPAWMLPAVGALITWLLGVTVYRLTGRLGVFGLGYEDLSAALRGNLAWSVAALLLAAKLIATCACYGYGGSGGIFAPTLFFGGMAGVAVGGGLAATVSVFNLDLPLTDIDFLTLAVVGMSSCLGAVVWAPVTGILIVFEMTHDFGLVPPLMIGALVSQMISRHMNRHNFYDALIAQDGHEVEHVRPPRDLHSWHSLPVSAIANFQPVVVRSLEPDRLQRLLKDHPYDRFPVIQGSQVAGILVRSEAHAALKEERVPKLAPVTTSPPSSSIRELQLKLIQSDTGMVVVLDQQRGKVLGLVTLHDLLRAETAMAKEGHG